MSPTLSKYRINTLTSRTLLMAAVLLVVAGCAGSKIVETKAPDYIDHSVRTLAIAPPDDLFRSDGNQLIDAIAVELGKRGYSVIVPRDTGALLTKYNISPVDVLTQQALTAFGKDGADAVLSVSSKAADIGGPGMRYVKATVTSARTSKQIGVINWTNSWGGMPGSPADYVTRKGPDAAAQEVAAALVKILG
jgi:hypothetical protein